MALLDIIRIVGGVVLGLAAVAPFMEAGKMRFNWKYVAKENIQWIGFGAAAALTIFAGWWLPVLVGGGYWLYSRSRSSQRRLNS